MDVLQVSEVCSFQKACMSLFRHLSLSSPWCSSGLLSHCTVPTALSGLYAIALQYMWGAPHHEHTWIPRRCSVPGACPALPMKLPDLIWKMSKAYSSLYVSTFRVSCINHLQEAESKCWSSWICRMLLCVCQHAAWSSFRGVVEVILCWHARGLLSEMAMRCMCDTPQPCLLSSGRAAGVPMYHTSVRS